MSAQPSSASSQTPYVGHFVDNFFWGNTLGEGGNSTVKLVYNPYTEQRLACKIFDARDFPDASQPSQEERDRYRLDRLRQVRKEYMMLQIVKGSPHANVCEFLGVRQSGETYYMFFELLTGGELFNHIVPDLGIPANLAKMYFVQICSAIAHMQSLGIAHRDIKGENCLLTGDLRTLKVTDFGWATLYKSQGITRTLTGAAGTEPYMCPEMHAKDRPYRADPVDYWSAGVVLIAMLTGEMPWDRAHPAEPEFVTWCQGNNNQMPFDRLTAEQLTFLRRLLCLRPSKRLFGDAVMQHPWIRSRDLPEPTRARGVTPMSSSSQVSTGSGSFLLSFASSFAESALQNLQVPPLGADSPPELTGGFTQPARFGCTPPGTPSGVGGGGGPCAAAELTASQLADTGEEQQPMRLSRMVLRLTRFFSTADVATTQAELLKALGSVRELRASQLGQGTISVTTTLPGTYPVAFKICLYLVRGSNILVEFRRTSGSGIRFNQFYMRLHSLLKPIVSQDAELRGLLAAAAASAASRAGNLGSAANAAAASSFMMDVTEEAGGAAAASAGLDDVTMHQQ